MSTMRLRFPLVVAVLALTAFGDVATPRSPSPPRTHRQAPTTHAVRRPVPRFSFRFNGRGFGHGVGMSQYGAYGAARAGMNADQIMAMYYTGTAISSLPPTTVRVQLVGSAPAVTVASAGAWVVLDDGAPLTAGQALPPATDLTLAQTAGVFALARADGALVARRPGPIVLSPAGPGGAISVNGVRYRGVVRVTAVPAGITVVNAVGLEDYLQGVVPLEMPAPWGDVAPAALEAQAIAARSYAMATRRTGDFDMYPDERSQMYGGVDAEDPRTSRAVQATAGRVVTSQGAVATTFFFSTSGGRTENAENVFGNPVPYLVSVDDARFDRLSPRFVWRGADVQTFTDARLGKLLGTKPVLNMRIVTRGVSGRAIQVRVTTRGGGVKLVSGAEIRRVLGLSSTWFSVVRSVQGTVRRSNSQAVPSSA